MYRALDGRGDPHLQLARALAEELDLSRITVVTAHEVPHAEQVVAMRAGSGTFVASVAERR